MCTDYNHQTTTSGIAVFLSIFGWLETGVQTKTSRPILQALKFYRFVNSQFVTGRKNTSYRPQPRSRFPLDMMIETTISRQQPPGSPVPFEWSSSNGDARNLQTTKKADTSDEGVLQRLTKNLQHMYVFHVFLILSYIFNENRWKSLKIDENPWKSIESHFSGSQSPEKVENRPEKK